MASDKLLLATTNAGKAREYRNLLAGIPFCLVTLADEGIATEVPETGRTFEENAALKATALARESGLLTLADDSGLEVDALNGEPGVLSARYAGENATDEERMHFLLNKLAGVPESERTARFRCVIAVATPSAALSLRGAERRGNLALSPSVELFSGACPGLIATAPRGCNGFGYDPVFYLPEMGKTMAEIPAEVKNKISHRARAAEKAREYLLKQEP